MNIAPNQVDASAPPFPHLTGEVLDRMQGGAPTDGAPNIVAKNNTNKLGHPPTKMSPKVSSMKPPKSKSEQKDQVEKQDSNDTQNIESDKPEAKKRRARKKWKKPKDKPNRPLSAYNLFFQSQRAAMLGNSASGDVDKTRKRVHRKTHGKVGFAEMARVIGTQWKNLPMEQKRPFEEQAAKEKERYANELQAWKQEQKFKARANKKNSMLFRGRSFNFDGSSSLAAGEPVSVGPMRSQAMVGGHDSLNPLMQQSRTQESRSMDYIRALQERQAERAAFLGRPNMDPALFQYPSAAEASANAILQQFQGMQSSAVVQGGVAVQPNQSSNPQAQLLELQKQQLELQQKQARLLELQQQMNSSQRQGNLDMNNLHQLRFQAAVQPIGGDLQQSLSTQQQLQYGPSASSGDIERMNQMSQFQPQFNGNMAAAVMRLQQRYRM